MANGIENIQGYGEAQVFPRSKGYGELVNNLQQERQYQFQRERQAQADKDRRNQDLYSLVGNELNPRDFNAVIHYKVKKAQEDLASEIIKSKDMDYGQMYLAAHNKAAELGQLSDSLNRVDQQIALTKKEYEGDKRINSGAIEIAARKHILDQIEKGGRVDESVNYFDKILNENPNIGLVDQSDSTFTDFTPEEKQPLEYNVKKRNPVGKVMQYKYQFDNYPAYYDVKQNGEFEQPTITVKSQSSGIKDASGNDVPMLSDDAYKRFSVRPSNVVAVNRRILKSNPGIDLSSGEAERLRRVEAYKDVSKYTPVPKENRVEQQPIIHVSTGEGRSHAAENWVNRAAAAIATGDENKVKDEFAELIGGDKNEYQKDVRQENGKYVLTYKPPKKFAIDGTPIPQSDEPVTFTIDPTDPYIKNQLVRLRQTIMGGDASLEKTNFGKQPATRTPIKRVYKGLDSQGNPIFE